MTESEAIFSSVEVGWAITLTHTHTYERCKQVHSTHTALTVLLQAAGPEH